MSASFQLKEYNGTWFYSVSNSSSPNYSVLIVPSTYEPSPGGHNYRIRKLVDACMSSLKEIEIDIPIFDKQKGVYECSSSFSSLFLGLSPKHDLSISFSNGALVFDSDISILSSSKDFIDRLGIESRIFDPEYFPDYLTLENEINMLEKLPKSTKVISVSSSMIGAADIDVMCNRILGLSYDYFN